MRAFLKRLLLFAAIQACVGAALLLNGPQRADDYMAATIDKNNRLDQTGPPRLILVGGSNLAFGIDSQTLERRTGLTTVNMGLHANLGRDFVLNETEGSVRPGDVVVVVMEYELLSGGASGQYVLDVIQHRPASLAYVPLSSYKEVLDEGLMYILRLVQRSVRRMARLSGAQPPYSRDSFNTCGDVVAHRAMASRYHPSEGPAAGLDLITRGGVGKAVVRLNSFHDRCRERGARVVWSYPPIDTVRLERNRTSISLIERVMRESLNMPILNEPAEVTYPVDLFFDTGYHLTEEGIRRRTELVGTRLVNWMRQEQGRAARRGIPASGRDIAMGEPVWHAWRRQPAGCLGAPSAGDADLGIVPQGRGCSTHVSGR